jgi:endoglucanase
MNRGKTWFWGLAALLVATGVAWYLLRPGPPPPPPPVPPGPSADVLARLARGVNLSNWLQHGRTLEPERYAPDEGDWQRIRALGFTHVRLPLDPGALVGDRGWLRPEALAELRGALDAAVRADLLVVVALQLPPALKLRLARNEADGLALGGTWRALAAALRDLPPERLVLEPLNEPELEDAADARAVQEFLVSELRAVLPKHTLVVSGPRYSSVADLAQLTPLADRNIVYGFHFYEPHNFTHQGANWGPPLWRVLRGLPYPSTPEGVGPLLASASAAAKDAVKWHGDERWSADKIAGRIDLAAQWAARHQAKVWCSEFGVLKKRVAAKDRQAWLRDTRAALEQRGIPWTHWDYAGDFGVAGGLRGKRVVDEGVVEALGLKSPSP